MNKVIIIAALIIAVPGTAHLVYVMERDISQDHERLEIHHRAQSVDAWNVASRKLESEFKDWIRDNTKLFRDRYGLVDLRRITIKTYEAPDVAWIDGRHVKVTGYISPEDGFWCTWENTLFMMDAGDWTTKGTAVSFKRVNPPPDNLCGEGWLVQVISRPL